MRNTVRLRSSPLLGQVLRQEVGGEPFASCLVLLVTIAGFWPFYLAGEGMRGRKISPQLFPLVLVHGTAMTAWVILFLIQSLLISTRNRKLHMKLGWSAIAIATVIAVTGPMVAVHSGRPAPKIPFWGMEYRQFLLIILAEVALFTIFVLAGILTRKRPEIHRAMMLLASLSILAGATVRMPILFAVFGESGWVGIFGPIFGLGATFLIIRSLLILRVRRRPGSYPLHLRISSRCA